MKALIQRVTNAKVTGKLVLARPMIHSYTFKWIFIIISVNDELVSNIGRGLCVLIGISQDDTKNEVNYM